jgi:hypothetical protein
MNFISSRLIFQNFIPKLSLLYLTLINATIKTLIHATNNKKPGTKKKGSTG